MYPNMVSKDILAILNSYQSNVVGWKLSGAGGGGYLIFISEKPLEKTIQVHIRRDN
jgi:mevalonate kinase